MARPETTIPLTVYYDADKQLHHQVRFAAVGPKGAATVLADVVFPRSLLGHLGWDWDLHLLVIERAEGVVRLGPEVLEGREATGRGRPPPADHRSSSEPAAGTAHA